MELNGHDPANTEDIHSFLHDHLMRGPAQLCDNLLVQAAKIMTSKARVKLFSKFLLIFILFCRVIFSVPPLSWPREI